MTIARDLYLFLERGAPWQVFWSSLFTGITVVRAGRRLLRGAAAYKDSAVLNELAGLPLTLVQSVAFVWAAIRLDAASMLLFLWWGPGLLTTAAVLFIASRRGRKIDWRRSSLWISLACKISYLVYMAVFAAMRMPQAMFAFSVWILNDQFEKSFLSLDADRTRRTAHDAWLFRMLYPAFLALPWIEGGFAFPWFSRIYGLVLFSLWIAGLVYVRRQGRFLALPNDPTLLRNIVYQGPSPSS
jgi:hypothetical protein